MISAQLIAPLIIAAGVAMAVTAAHRRVPPMIAAQLMTATIAAVSFAVAPATLVIAFGYLAHQPLFGGTLAWCRGALGVHAAVPSWLGLPAVVLVVLAVIRTRSVIGSWRRYRRRDVAVPEVVESEALFAYTLPGPAGQIVLSSGLVGELSPEELAVVLAHERAHVLHRHDRLVLVADLANAILPLVRPLQRRLVFVLERWADESAVATMGGDRRVVARTLARVALSHAGVPAPAAAFGGLGVAARVDALLDPPPGTGGRLWMMVMVAGVVAVAIAGVVQVHHVLPLLVALCPG